MKAIGFTGTRKGMTSKQKVALLQILEREQPQEFHHGDCLGADADAHRIAMARGIDVILHPPANPRYRAFCKKNVTVVRPPLPFLDRNHAIVDEVEMMVATPGEVQEQR